MRFAVIGASLVLASVILGAVILLTGNKPFLFDGVWNSWLDSWHVPAVTTFALVMSWLGGGWFGIFAVPIAGALLLFLLRRPWSAVFFLSAEIVSAAAVQVLKHVFGRARPEEIIIVSDYGSFPSGHTANAATLAVAFFVLFPRLWVAIIGAAWIVLMALARTIVHAHWLSDTLGGAMIGAGAVLIVAAVVWPLIAKERRTDAPREAPSLG